MNAIAHDTIEQHLIRAAEMMGLMRSPYFIALEDGSMTKAEFVATQQQFFHAVDFFNRPLAALAARIPCTRARMPVVHNVWEEHGEGDAKLWHRNTFQALLARLGGPIDPEVLPRGPEVHAFNTLLMGCTDDHRVGAACLGAVETLFSPISALIGRGIVSRGWLPEDQVVHYAVHEVLDIDHGRELLDVVRDDWAGPHRRAVAEGLRLGVYAFDALYRSLYMARGRGWA